MSVINEPLLYTLIALSTFYLYSGGLNAAFTANVAKSWKTPAVIAEILVKGFVFVSYSVIFGFACNYMAVTIDPVPANRTIDNAEEVTPLLRTQYLFAITTILTASFFLTQINLYLSWYWFGGPKEKKDIRFHCPLGYEAEVVQTLSNRGKTSIEVETDQNFVGLQLIFFLAYVAIMIAINGGWYRPNGTTLTNWNIINLTSVVTGLVVLMVRTLTLPKLLPERNQTVKYVDLLYMRRFGEMFHTSWQGQHVLWFMPQWLIMLICTFEVATYIELFNDYPRVFFASILTVFIPIMQALATHTLASWWYFSLLAKVFFYMVYWNVTVHYPGFSTQDIKSAVPEGYRRWFYFLWDWNGDHTYEVETTLGVRYGLAVIGLVLAVAGIVQYVIEFMAVKKKSTSVTDEKMADKADNFDVVSFPRNEAELETEYYTWLENRLRKPTLI